MEASPFHAPRARLWALQADAVLCRAGARGNQEAFDELYRRYERQLIAFVFHLLGGRHRREDAEEVVQDAFARAFSSVRMRDFEGSFRALLFVVARNRAIDAMRRERLAVVPLEEDGADDVPRANIVSEPGPAAESREDLAWLVRAIGDLPERQRSALLLRELGGLSHESIADELGTSVGSVRQLIGRGRDGVRSAAGADENAPTTLRRGLLDAVPWAPVAALGGAAAVGSGAGGLGMVAVGKLAAALLAVTAIAGAGGAIERQVSAAEEPAAPSAKVSASGAKTSNTRRSAGPGKTERTTLRGERSEVVGHADGGRSTPDGSEAPASGDHAGGGHGPQPSQQNDSGPASAPAPLQPVTDLPSKLLDDVGAGLSGEKPLPEVVGDVVANTVGTVGQTVTGLLDAPTDR